MNKHDPENKDCIVNSYPLWRPSHHCTCSAPDSVAEKCKCKPKCSDGAACLCQINVRAKAGIPPGMEPCTCPAPDEVADIRADHDEFLSRWNKTMPTLVKLALPTMGGRRSINTLLAKVDALTKQLERQLDRIDRMNHAMANLIGERNALTAQLEAAPHHPDCAVKYNESCNCWKSKKETDK